MGELKIFVRGNGDGERVALSGESGLLEYYEQEAQSLVGAVFVGRVERVLPDVKAAFVKLGLPLNGFLPLRESESFHRTCGDAPLMSGQEIIVQVRKDPKGGKGAFLTRDISLPGQYVLLMPRNRFVGMSKRIQGEADRAGAKALGQAVAQDRFGVIVRHAALFASRAEVLEEAEALWANWQKWESRASALKAPVLLFREPSAAEVLARDYAARHALTLLADSSAPDGFPIAWNQLSTEEMDAEWRRAHIDKQVAAALRRRVELPDGASLVIDEREALQTIDVNSGRNVHASGEDSLALEENLRVVSEIARQIRLRNLSGIILIDFIDMAGDAERARVEAAMQQAISDDRVKTVIHGFTRLGLLEMTRKRTRDTLMDALTKPCAACRETGRVPRD